MAGKKKISEFPVVIPVGTDKFLIEQADGSYKSVLSSDVVPIVDSTVTEGSTNPVSGNAVFVSLAEFDTSALDLFNFYNFF